MEVIEVPSKHLGEDRELWVSLPMRFDPEETYPVLYVLDAEWRFDLVRALAYDLSGNRKIPRHIVVGIPHREWEKQRGVDLTFSESRVEVDGQVVGTETYNAGNASGGARFLRHLAEEVVPTVAAVYKTGKNVLVGHSYGGYFGAYLLTLDHPFDALQSYDPSVWYGDGEIVRRVERSLDHLSGKSIFLTSQPEPTFHAAKIDALRALLNKQSAVRVGSVSYDDESHNSLFLPSFLAGMKFLYSSEVVSAE